MECGRSETKQIRQVDGAATYRRDSWKKRHDDESIEALNTIDMLKRKIIELEAEIATLKARMRDMG